jgi:hypothetical protein
MPFARLAVLVVLSNMGVSLARAEMAAQVANITLAVTRIAAVEKESGYMGALVDVQQCYLRELKTARTLTRELEACLAQDIIISRVAAATLAKIPEGARKASGSLEPNKIMRSMLDRVPKVFARFQIAEPQVREFMQLVNKHGFDAYGRARFPKEFLNKN